VFLCRELFLSLVYLLFLTIISDSLQSMYSDILLSYIIEKLSGFVNVANCRFHMVYEKYVLVFCVFSLFVNLLYVEL